MILLIILIALTVGSIVWLILDLAKNYKLWHIPLIILLTTIFFGWFVAGITVPIKTEQIKVTTPIEILKSSTKVYVEVDSKTWEFNSHEGYILINDSTVFYYSIDYNMYGIELSRKLKIKR